MLAWEIGAWSIEVETVGRIGDVVGVWQCFELQPIDSGTRQPCRAFTRMGQRYLFIGDRPGRAGRGPAATKGAPNTAMSREIREINILLAAFRSASSNDCPSESNSNNDRLESYRDASPMG